MSRLEFGGDVAAWLRGGVPVVVTGAGGWLGQAVLEMLCTALGDALPAQVTAYGATARPFQLRSGRMIDIQAYRTLGGRASPPALIFHFAFLTREHAAAMPPGDYLAANRDISAAMAAFIRRNGAAGLVLPSSGAATGAAGDFAGNPYGALKAEDEARFAGLARARFPAAIIRVFNLSGPFINKLKSYALASIIGDIAKGGPVTLRAAHPVWRSYTHVEDLLRLATAIIQRGMNPPVFDTAGEAIEIGALAARAANLLAPHQPVAIDRPDWAHAAPDRYLGNGETYFQLAAACGLTPRALDGQIIGTAAYTNRLKGFTGT